MWLVFFKGKNAVPGVSYEEAVEEALCFGWIDSVIQRIDDKRYARKFTPRREGSNWSATNKRLAAKLIREGRMTEAGLQKLTFTDDEDDYGRTPQRREEQLVVPEYMRRAISRNRKAWENFSNLAPSYRRSYILWIEAAKTKETRVMRIEEATRLLAKNEKLGMR